MKRITVSWVDGRFDGLSDDETRELVRTMIEEQVFDLRSKGGVDFTVNIEDGDTLPFEVRVMTPEEEAEIRRNAEEAYRRGVRMLPPPPSFGDA